MKYHVLSLNEIAKNSILANIGNWLQYLPDDNCDGYLYVISPFDVLDNKLTQVLLNDLATSQNCKRKHLHLLLHSNFTVVDLSCLTYPGLIELALKILMGRTKNLIGLTIKSSQTKITGTLLGYVPSSFPCVRYLHLALPSLKDDFCSALSKFCHNLEVLEIGNAKQIGEKSIRLLVHCKLLKSLRISHVQHFTYDGMISILVGLPKLTMLALPFCDIHLAADWCRDSNFNRITSLDLSMNNLSDKCIYHIVTTFVNLTHLNVSNNEEITSECLKDISTLSNLNTLNISYTGINTWNTALINLVKICGKNYLVLDLSGVMYVDLPLLVSHCPYINTLILLNCKGAKTGYVESNKCICSFCARKSKTELIGIIQHCQKIKTFQINPELTNYSPQNQFDLESVLQNSSSLTNLTLSEIPRLNDDMFAKMMNKIQNSCLEQIDISCNKHLTDKSVYLIIQMFPSVKFIIISNCDIISQEYRKLIYHVKTFKLNIKIIW